MQALYTVRGREKRENRQKPSDGEDFAVYPSQNDRWRLYIGCLLLYSHGRLITPGKGVDYMKRALIGSRFFVMFLGVAVSKTISGMKGDWNVDVLDQAGAVLKSATFKVE